MPAKERKYFCDSCKGLTNPPPVMKCPGCMALKNKAYEMNRRENPRRKEYLREYQRRWQLAKSRTPEGRAYQKAFKKKYRESGKAAAYERKWRTRYQYGELASAVVELRKLEKELARHNPKRDKRPSRKEEKCLERRATKFKPTA